MRGKPYLILDTPRGPDGACWFVADASRCSESAISKVTTQARNQLSDGLKLVGRNYVAVAAEAEQVRDSSRTGQEFLILCGLTRDAMQSASEIREILSELLGKLEPMSGQTIESDRGQTSLVRTGPAIRNLESETLERLEELQPKVAAIRSVKKFVKPALGILIGVAAGILLVRVGGPVLNSSSNSEPSVEKSAVAIFEDSGWEKLYQANQNPGQARADFLKALHREFHPEISVTEVVSIADLEFDAAGLLSTAEELAASEISTLALSRQFISNRINDPVFEELFDFSIACKQAGLTPADSGVYPPRAVIQAWTEAIQTYAAANLVSGELESASNKLQILAPSKEINFLTPKDNERLRAVLRFTSVLFSSNPPFPNLGPTDWEDAPWGERIETLKKLEVRYRAFSDFGSFNELLRALATPLERH